MLRSRITPFLLLNNNFLEKTVKFKNPKYIGDPLNAVKIFNEKHADELAIVDYTATTQNREINFKLLKQIAEESRMPLSYSGGIRSIEQAKKLISFGIEKICISSAYFENKSLCKQLINSFGAQSVVVVLDVKKNFFGKYEIYTHQGTQRASNDVYKEIKNLCEIGVGEIIINNISNDGTMQGYDIDLAENIYNLSTIPITILGGAGSEDHFKELISITGPIGCGAGSLFVFKGKYKAVLINYPSMEKKIGINANILKK